MPTGTTSAEGGSKNRLEFLLIALLRSTVEVRVCDLLQAEAGTDARLRDLRVFGGWRRRTVQAGPTESSGRGLPPLARPDTKVIQTIAGARLASLFEGLKANPLYSLQWIQSRQRPHSACTSHAATTGLTWFERLLGVSTVYAAEFCTGSGWAPTRLQCPIGGTCKGQSLLDSAPDPEYYNGGFYPTPNYCARTAGAITVAA